MLRRLWYLGSVVAMGGLLLAQEGHPLTGSWHGEWGAATAKAKTPIVMFLKWNNKSVEGTLNPADWTVHIEGATKDGQAVSADGKLGDIGSYNRTITGTWTQGKSKGNFQLKRD